MHNAKISIIVAMDEKRGIGKNNALMWKIPGELPRFKKITTGHPIIMGRKTYESIGRPLPHRTNIVITRDQAYKVEGVTVVHSLNEAIGIAQNVISFESEDSQSLNDLNVSGGSFQQDSSPSAQNDNHLEIFIIGGGQIFTEALPFADRLYLTLVKGDFKADVFFPDYKAFTKVIEKEDHKEGEYQFQFVTLEK